MQIQLETWEDDETPDVTMRLTEIVEGSAVPTVVDITGKTIKVRLWLNKVVAREITNTVIVDGPNGVFKFPKVQAPVIPAGRYGVAIQVSAPKRTYPSSKFLPTWTVNNVGEAQ